MSSPQRDAAQVVVLECDEVEGEEGGRQLDRGLTDVQRVGEAAAPLQPREARLAMRIHHHDLAIQDAGVVRQRLHRSRDLGEDVRVIESVAREEHDVVSPLRRDQAIAIELELEQPVVVGERVVARLGEHQLHLTRVDA